jgi:hypothetical protein
VVHFVENRAHLGRDPGRSVHDPDAWEHDPSHSESDLGAWEHDPGQSGRDLGALDRGLGQEDHDPGQLDPDRGPWERETEWLGPQLTSLSRMPTDRAGSRHFDKKTHHRFPLRTAELFFVVRCSADSVNA